MRRVSVKLALAVFIALLAYTALNEAQKAKLNVQDAIFDFYQISQEQKTALKALSKAQLAQDIFVYLELNQKSGGFFIEFGATDGIALSNSYMLERHFNWRGILAEPAKSWHKRLRSNRPNSIIETSCIYKDTGSKLMFNETEALELSTIDRYSDADHHSATRQI